MFDNKYNYVKDSQPCSNDIIPSVLSIQNFSIGPNKNIEINKLSKYNFPKEDKGPTPAGLQEISPAESLKYLVNLFCHRVTPAVKYIYDTMCMRDVSFKEISKNGIPDASRILSTGSHFY